LWLSAGWVVQAQVNPAPPSQGAITPATGISPAVPTAPGVVPTVVPSATVSAGNNIILTLANAPVQDTAGNMLGRLEYVVVNPSGQIDLGLLQMGGARFVPLPWQFVSSAPNTATPGMANRPLFRIPLDREKLMQAPAVNQSGLAQLIPAGSARPFYAHFGLVPATAVGGTGAAEGLVTGSGTRFPPNSQLGAITNMTNRTQNPVPGSGRTDSPFVAPSPKVVPTNAPGPPDQNLPVAPPGQPTPPPPLPPVSPPTAPVTPQPVPSNPGGGTPR
jgi:hypothetical protein